MALSGIGYARNQVEYLLQHSRATTLFSSYKADFAVSIAFALLFPLLRFTLDKLVYQRIGQYMLLPNAKKTDTLPTDAQRKTVIKWQESCWKATVYGGFAAFALLVTRPEKFFRDTTYFWKGCTDLPCEAPVPIGIRLLYCLELGFYFQAIPSLMFWEVRRKDFAEQMAHHFATIGLIVYSYYLNFTRVGAMVFLCHDVNDIFLEAAKLAKYTKREMTANVLFVIFVISWFASRLYYYPFYVIRSTLFETLEEAQRVHFTNLQPHYTVFNGLLLFLMALHFYWTYLILRILVKAVKSNVEDIREEDDD